jgi:hypothetical protein
LGHRHLNVSAFGELLNIKSVHAYGVIIEEDLPKLPLYIIAAPH